MSSAGDKYAMDDESHDPTCAENCGNCQCEKCTPDKENIIYSFVIIGLGVLAVVAGTYIGRETIQSIEDYNFPVNDAAGAGVAMANVLIYKEVAAIYIPGGNSSYLGSSTQAFFDFEKNITSFLDTENNICFIQEMDKTDIASFNILSEALLKGKKIMSMPAAVTKNKMKFTDAPYTRVRSMGTHAKNECQRMKRVYIISPGTVSATVGINCTVTNLPSYAIAKVSGADLLQIKEFNQIESACVKP